MCFAQVREAGVSRPGPSTRSPGCGFTFVKRLASVRARCRRLGTVPHGSRSVASPGLTLGCIGPNFGDVIAHSRPGAPSLATLRQRSRFSKDDRHRRRDGANGVTGRAIIGAGKVWEPSEQQTVEGWHGPHPGHLMSETGTVGVVIAWAPLILSRVEPAGGGTLRLWKWTGFIYFRPGPCWALAELLVRLGVFAGVGEGPDLCFTKGPKRRGSADRERGRTSGGLAHPASLPREEAPGYQVTCRAVGRVSRAGRLGGSTPARSRQGSCSLLADRGRAVGEDFLLRYRWGRCPAPATSLGTAGGQGHRECGDPMEVDPVQGEAPRGGKPCEEVEWGSRPPGSGTTPGRDSIQGAESFGSPTKTRAANGE